jgi:2Fe-2S ferredoxin
MAQIVIANWSEKIIETKDLSKTLLQQFHDQNLDWMHACGAKGRCTTCKAIVIQGIENFQPLTPAEEKYRQSGMLKNNERLCCQAKIKADISILVPEEYKLPHINYGSK